MDYQQQPHHYMRPPPPPPTTDHYHHQQDGQPPVPPPPAPWYPSPQFQYHQPPPSQHHSPPPPPPPHHQQWAPPPSYPAPPPPYQAHPLHDQYQQRPPPYHPNAQIPQSYPQDWGNANWGHHQSWDYPVHPNEEDWAAKARAWAAASSTTDYQNSQSQHYQDQYPQTSNPHYPDVLQSSNPAPSYQPYQPPAAPSHRPHMAHLQESASISAGQSSFAPDDYLSYSARDGNLGGNSNSLFPPQESSPTTSSVHLQEVPSSYSSVTGMKEPGDQNEQLYRSFPLPIDSNQALHHLHPPLPAVCRSMSIEQPHYAVSSQSTKASSDLSDQPLVFSPGFNHNRDPHTQPSYIHTDSGAPTSSHSWITPVVPGTVFPPIPTHDPPIPSSVPGHSAALFGRMPGPSFQPAVPSVGTPFGIGAISGHHPTTVFTPDVYGGPGVPERPKKASVPNWLREEIIKNKSAITTSSLEHPKEENESLEDEAVARSLGKADQADNKSIDSSKSTEEEDEDEDDVEAARTAAINQEIKRILTEVLLKVTDELFDEIATKVMREDDLAVEIDQNVVGPNPKLSPSAPAFPTPKASARVIVPAKAEEPENEDGNGKSTSPGDVLGLGSYASDDDEDDENTLHPLPNTRKLSEDRHSVENGRSQEEAEGYSKDLRKEEGGAIKLAPNGRTNRNGDSANKLNEKRTSRISSDSNIGSRYRSRTVLGAKEDEDNLDKKLVRDDDSRTDHVIGEKGVITESPLDNSNSEKQVTDEVLGKETRNNQDKDDMHGETKRSSYGKDIIMEVASGKGRTDEREDERRKRQDERHLKRDKERERERTYDRNGSKEKMKEQAGKSREKANESDSRKRSVHPDDKEDRKEKERDRRAEDDGDRRRELTKDERGERSRHRISESSRHKRRRSSSVSSRGKSSKDNSVVSRANDSSEELSDDSRRKLHSKRRNLSPSPNRSRRRQDSRSPRSKRSQRRHSPYSSLETTRRRRSRSRSPARRQR